MKLKHATLAMAVLAGAMTAHAGLRVGFSLGGGRSFASCRPASSNFCNSRYGYCQPVGCYASLPYFWYWGSSYCAGYYPYYADCAPYASFSNGSGDPAPVPVYQVPPPVFPTQPVKVYPLAFGWKQ